MRIALLLLALAAPVAAQDLLLPGPEERTTTDCALCPVLVTLPNGLLMSQAPVTRGEFRAFVEATGFRQDRWGCKWDHAHIEQDDTHPLVCISFDEAQAYADWLSSETGRAYRLPSLAEMRYAAKGGESGTYWWGQSVGRGRANCIGCGTGADGAGTTPVGSFRRNPYHLEDAVGNVWIWTSDCPTEDCAERYLVGGGWSNPPADLRVENVISHDAATGFNTYGMRVVRAQE